LLDFWRNNFEREILSSPQSAAQSLASSENVAVLGRQRRKDQALYAG
jgi:hypothetical protein